MTNEAVPSRIAILEAAHQRQKAKCRANRRNLHPAMRRFDSVPLNEIGEELGVSRERVRQLEARALRKLCSTSHRVSVEEQLDAAIVIWGEAKASGNEKRMLWAIHNVDALLDALTWLEEFRTGALRDRLREAEARQDEPTQYIGSFSASSNYLTIPRTGKSARQVVRRRVA
jgi:DNA-binding CsgD family transcriptional regulator